MTSRTSFSKIRLLFSWSIIAVCAISIALIASSCGGGGGETHAGSSSSRVVGQVLVQNAALARMTNGKSAQRAATQVAGCSAVPTGYTAISGATVNVSGNSETATTDSSGCFSMTLTTSGVKVFTATKTNTAGGTTTLKKAVTMAQNSDLTFVTSDAMTEMTTIAAIIVEQKMANNESNIDPAATETYVASIQDQDDIQGLLTSIQAAADPNDSSVASFDAIDTSVITESEQTTDQPVIYSAAITGSPVAKAGGSIAVTAKIAAYGTGVSITEASTTLAATGSTSISIPMSLSSGITYSGSYTFPANDTGSTITYKATINAVDSNSATGSYTSSSFTVAHTGNTCGDGNVDTANGETCDEGDANATTCTPAVGRMAAAAPSAPQCSYCDSTTCQTQTITWECGDGEVQSGIGEQCDDGNTTTETCDYGQTSCTVCNSSCASVAGATSYCGDGNTDTANGETCDDGGTADGDGCDSSCHTQAVCGNDTIETGEQCDDGNTDAGDGCDASCQYQAMTPSTVMGVSASNICVKTDGGALKCWGSNTYGPLGDGVEDSAYPLPYTSISDVASILINGQSIYVLSSSGGLKSWGQNGQGQLGDGTTTDRSTPVDVTGLTSGVAFVAGGDTGTACAVTTGGGVKCWGDNSSGKLGDGTTTNSSVPVDANGFTSGVSQVALMAYETCVLTTTGGVKCWGRNMQGQLGDGTTTESATPVDVTGLTSGVAAITGGFGHACALTTSGGMKCWGRNDRGQLGDGSTTQSSVPVDVTGLTSGVEQIGASGTHTCALTTSGGVKCWGYNSYGQLGNGSTTNSSLPVDVTGLTSGVEKIAVGSTVLALTTSGEFKAWGYNNYGQLGDGTETDRSTPVDIVLSSYCGDSKKFPPFGEQCDDGNNTSGDGCDATCQSEGVCGNNYTDTDQGETCDDGNTTPGDGCSDTCQSECSAGSEMCTQDSDCCSNVCMMGMCM